MLFDGCFEDALKMLLIDALGSTPSHQHLRINTFNAHHILNAHQHSVLNTHSMLINNTIND